MADVQSTVPWRCENPNHAHTDNQRGPTCQPDSLLHPDHGSEERKMEHELPVEGERYVNRRDPGKIVTVTSVWTDDNGEPAVAYEWRDRKPGRCGSACPVRVFRREYDSLNA